MKFVLSKIVPLSAVATSFFVLAAARCHAAPANDNVANAQVIAPGSSFTINGSNVGATTEAFETAPGYPAQVILNSVWFSLTPTTSGFLTTDAERANEVALNTCVFKAPGTPSKATYVTQDPFNHEGSIRSQHVDAGQQYFISLSNGSAGSPDNYTFTGTLSPEPIFFSGEKALSGGVYYLAFSNGTPFGYYSYLSDAHYIYHFDLGFEYVFDAADGKGGVYLYDFASKTFFYTSPSFPFPYLYDFTLKTVLYYYPDASSTGHYTTNPRYFYDFGSGKIITK